jgi:hypothetical protein
LLFQWKDGQFRHPDWVLDICWTLPIASTSSEPEFWFPDDAPVDSFVVNWFDSRVVASNLHVS